MSFNPAMAAAIGLCYSGYKALASSVITRNIPVVTFTSDVMSASPGISLSELRAAQNTKPEFISHALCKTARYASVIFETNLYEKTTLAPNPTHGKITIHASKTLIGWRFSIHDNAGKKIVDSQLLDYTIDLSDFSPGMYT